MSVINFDLLYRNAEKYKSEFESGIFGFTFIDGFLNEESINEILDETPNPNATKINKSRDYIFAKNKFEKSSFYEFGDSFHSLYTDLISLEFSNFLESITGESVFIDPAFHGGGLHQGGVGSFLDMHTDFNYHPVNTKWFRNLNVILYLNPDWKSEYGGELQLRNKNTGESAVIQPILNRCVIMHTRDYTLHGYNKINFPEDTFRQSIAAYAYTEISEPETTRSTTWYPNDSGVIKLTIGKNWPRLVKLKNKFFGSSTKKN